SLQCSQAGTNRSRVGFARRRTAAISSPTAIPGGGIARRPGQGYFVQTSSVLPPLIFFRGSNTTLTAEMNDVARPCIFRRLNTRKSPSPIEWPSILNAASPIRRPRLGRRPVFRSLDGHERDVRRIRTVRTEGALEDEMVPTRQGRMKRHEGDVDHFLQETGASRERRERVRDRFRGFRFRDDPEGRFRDDPQRSFRAEEQRGEVREMAA